MAKYRKTSTGTEGAPQASVETMDELAEKEGIDPLTSQDAPDSSQDSTPSPTTPEPRSAAVSDGNASDTGKPVSAAPASLRQAAPTPEAPRQKRSVREGAVRLEGLPNEYRGEDAEHMMKEVVVYALASRRVSIGLKHWDIREKLSYIVPRWYALSHKNLFVIQGE